MLEVSKIHISWEEENFQISSTDPELVFNEVSVDRYFEINNDDIYKVYLETNKGLHTKDIRIHNSYDYVNSWIVPKNVVHDNMVVCVGFHRG
jgi:hypothetical protein